MISDVEGGLRASVRERLHATGMVPVASKLYQPAPGLVPRDALVARVLADRGDVITVTAPAGYGKSTFLAELTRADPRPTAWVSVTASDNDPAALLTYIAAALDDVEPVDPAGVLALWARPPRLGSPTLANFGAMLASRRRPFVLVLDDVHELTERDVLDTLPVLVAELPPGSTIVLAGRAAVPLPLGRLRVRRRLVELGTADLAFDDAEAAVFLGHLAIDASPAARARLVERVEGWPVGVYLAALAHAARPSTGDELADVAGDHRYFAEYLAEELLTGLDPAVATFLMEASCFERVSGRLCDEVLERAGSAQLLERAHRRNLLVVALDEHREWYRFHQLMIEFLQDELARRDPDRRRAIHVRAARWCDAHGDGDGAVTHAARSGDLDLAESMVVRWLGAVASGGRPALATSRWTTLLPDDRLAERPTLMVVAAWDGLVHGDPDASLSWLSRAAAATSRRPAALAVARAFIAARSPEEITVEASAALEQGGEDGHPECRLLLGAAAFMAGDDRTASDRFAEGVEGALERPVVVASCLAHQAVIDVEHGRWADATVAARRARALVGELAALPTSVLAMAVSVLVETRAGRAEGAEADRLLSRRHLARLAGVAPWLTLQARLALARAAVLAGDRDDAVALLDEAEATLARTPGAVRVAEQVDIVRRDLVARDRSQRFGPASLTRAELRVLQLLPTHLSVSEIADRLYVSRNTVKSQTIAIYRKLGASSRSAAVTVAAAAGLLEDVARLV